MTARVRSSDLRRALAAVPEFPAPRAELEQVTTPVGAAVLLLDLALALDDLAGRTVLDLGCGTGRLSVGASLLGAASVRGVDVDPAAIDVARRHAARVAIPATFELADVADLREPADTVVMNPPFGAQQRHADRPFWDSALRLARRRVYAFSLSDSRIFIQRRTVEAGALVESTRPVPWELPRLFPHHRRDRVPLAVDLWVIRTEKNDDERPGASEVRSAR